MEAGSASRYADDVTGTADRAASEAAATCTSRGALLNANPALPARMVPMTMGGAAP
jgi:hypothetical protein